MADMKRRVGSQFCLTGTDEEVTASTRCALQHGVLVGGYIFGTSNCIHTGMRHARYQLRLDIWRLAVNYS